VVKSVSEVRRHFSSVRFTEHVYRYFLLSIKQLINPLIATLKPQSNGPPYSNTVIGTLAVDGWAVTFGTAPPSPLLAVRYQM